MLGARIAVLRRGCGLSQGELAQKLQVSPSAIGMYEQGRREPSVDLLVSMAQIFGVTVDYLLTGQPEQIPAQVKEVFDQTDKQEEKRPKRPLSREELAVLFAALLLDA